MDETFGTSCLRFRSYRDLLREILLTERRGKSALARDLVQDLGRPRNTVHQQLTRLQEDGFIEIEGDEGKVKSVLPTDEGRAIGVRLGATILGRAPVLGRTSVGLTRLAPTTVSIEGEQNYLASWDEILPPTEDFALFLVQGGSMSSDNIVSGDRVQIELDVQLNELEQDEIAVVRVGDEEATLKHVYYDQETDLVTLWASDPNCAEIVVAPEAISVIGAYYGVVRVNEARARRRRK